MESFGVYEKIADRVKPYRDSVIVCLETAADFLSISNGGLYNDVMKVYSEQNIDDKHIEVHILPGCFDKKAYMEWEGVYCTTLEQTLIDMIENENEVDIQTLLESLSNYYYEHNETFGKIESLMDERQLEVFETLRQDAVDYYNDY